jgi:hypothetical protein
LTLLDELPLLVELELVEALAAVELAVALLDEFFVLLLGG